MICRNCGANVRGNATYCTSCGASLYDASAAPDIGDPCPNCGASVPRGSRFCPACRADLAPAAPISGGGRDRRMTVIVLLGTLIILLAALVVILIVVLSKHDAAPTSSPATTVTVTSETPTPTPTETSTATDDPFYFPESMSRKLTEAELSAYTDEDLQLMINEIYACHGKSFKDKTKQAPFDGKSWYHPQYDDDKDVTSRFSPIEQYNVDLIRSVLDARKAPAQTPKPGDSSYDFPELSTRVLTSEELNAMDLQQVQLAINQIYAVHHLKFENPTYKAHFEQKSWYTGTVESTNAQSIEDGLKGAEQKNFYLLVDRRTALQQS